jgi:hypothetical protein
MSDTTETDRLRVGDPVATPDGPGRLDGFQVDARWTFDRPALRTYIVVTLKEGGRRVYPAAQVRAAG